MKKSLEGGAFRSYSPGLKFLLLMKLSFGILLITCMQVSANAYSQEKFSLHFKQAEVAKILTAIQDQSSYRFFYNNGYINKLGKIDLEVTDALLPDILNT